MVYFRDIKSNKLYEWEIVVDSKSSLSSSGTLFFYNIHKFHTDPEHWNEPELFDPTRFLNEDGTKVIKPERFVPFGFGKRMCMGEALAKAELLILTTTLIQVC